MRKHSPALKANPAPMKQANLRNDPRTKRPCFLFKKAGIFLLIFLLVVIAFLLIKLSILSSTELAFYRLVPAEAVVYSVVDQDQLYQQLYSFGPFIQRIDQTGSLDKLFSAVKQTGLDFNQEIQRLFQRQIALVLLPADDQSPLPFSLLLKARVSANEVNQVLKKVENNLRLDYVLAEEAYRQIKVRSLTSLRIDFALFYAQINDYLIISNSDQAIRKIIDSIIQSH